MESRFPASSLLDGAQRIGAGGCGIVYSAHHAEWGKVAVKVAINTNDDIRQLFLSEYTLLRSFQHNAILKAYDFFYLDDQRPVITMQLCDGGNIYEVADPLPLEQRFRNLGQILSALEYLHVLGLIHRDLKGENILVSRTAGPQLSDLGLAAAKEADTRERGGTLEYMAPEVIDNRGATADSDIYSLGIILYRLATGSLPFTAVDPLQVISRKQQPDLLPIDQLAQATSPRFARLVRQCIDPNPAERPHSVKDVAEQLLMDDLINASDFGAHNFADYFHHYLYSYNASFCRQELKNLPTDLLIAHCHQHPAVKLDESISDFLKLAGYEVSVDGDFLRYGPASDTGRSVISLAADDDTDRSVTYHELDRFAFDAILRKIATKEIEISTANLIFELSSGNLALVACLLHQLEQEERFDVRSGRLRLPAFEALTFEPAQEYYDLATRMLPEIPGHLREIADFLSCDNGGYPVRELLALGRIQRDVYDELIKTRLLSPDSGAMARGYYRSCLYRSLSPQAAQLCHLGWIRVIEETDDLTDEMRGRLLVHHYSRSGEVSSAIAASLKLAEILKGEQKLQEAALILEQACRFVGSQANLHQYVQLLVKRADLLIMLGHLDGALSAYSAIVRYGLRIGDKEAVATAYRRSGDVYKGKRDYSRGNRALDRAVKYYGEQGNELELSHCYNNIGNIYWISGDIDKAAANYEKALRIQRALGALRDVASSLSNLGTLQCMQQEFASGISLFKESIEIKKQLNDLPELARTYNNLSVAYFEQDELVTASEYLKQAFEINKSIGAKTELLHNYDNFHDVEFRRGNYAKAREWVIEGLKNSPPEAHSVRGGFIASLANLSIIDGRYGKAGALIAAAKAREEKVTDRWLSMKIAAVASEYFFTLHDFASAYDSVQTAIEHAQKMGETKSHAIFLIRRARIERAVSRPSEEILVSLSEAAQFLGQLPVKREKLELILEHAEFAFSTGAMADVERKLAEAIDYPEFDGIVSFRSRLYLLRGLLELQRGNTGKALHLVNDAVLAAKSLRLPEALWYCLMILGDCHRKQNQFEQALKSYIESFNTVKQLAGEIGDKRLRKLYLTDKRKGMIGKRLEEMSSLVA